MNRPGSIARKSTGDLVGLIHPEFVQINRLVMMEDCSSSNPCINRCRLESTSLNSPPDNFISRQGSGSPFYHTTWHLPALFPHDTAEIHIAHLVYS